jgi:hypothetical protein
MKEHKVNSLNNFISGYYWKDISALDQISNYFKSNTKIANRGSLIKNGVSTVVTDKKDSYDMQLPPPHEYEFSKIYFENLQETLNLYLNKYQAANDCSAFNANIPNIQFYKPGGHFNKWHCERSSGNPNIVFRHLVFMTYLNDVEDCGETEFFYQKIKVKPEKGLTLIWPTDWTHTHRGVPSLTEEKMIVTGWFSFLPL